jgi:uncharacterized spore protein YtfJ
VIPEDELTAEVKMDAREILEHARDALTVRRVFGEPIEREGVLVVPVARLMGGAGSGSGEEGGGGGWGGAAAPAGVYVIDGQDVRWQPALDLNRVILGGQIAFVIGLLVLRSILRTRRRRL